MPFGYSTWTTTPAAIDTLAAIQNHQIEIINAVHQGIPPITIIAADISEHLGENLTNSRVGRMISDWLGLDFQVVSRAKWKRVNGTESGSIFRQRGN